MSGPTEWNNPPVLDRQALDAAADRAMAGLRIDLADVERRALARRRRTRRQARRRTTGWLLAAAAAAVLVAVLVPGVPRLISQPPAAVPTGEPGALPDRIFAAPPWAPSVTDAPIARVALVVETQVIVSDWSRSNVRGPMLVSADGAQYRSLPGHDVYNVSVSPDGRRVAWSDVAPYDSLPGTPSTPSPGTVPATAHWVTTATGRQAQADLAVDGRPTVISALTWSPTGEWIAVSLRYRAGDSGTAQESGLSVVDTRTGRVWPACGPCWNDVAFDAAGRLLVARDTDPASLTLPPAISSRQMPGPRSTGGGFEPALINADGTERLHWTKDDDEQPRITGPLAAGAARV